MPKHRLGEKPKIADCIHTLMTDHTYSLQELVSSSLRMLISERSPLARIMQYCLDVAGDQYISEEFYQNYPEILGFLSKSGCDNEEVLFRAYVLSHPDILNCKHLGCHGKIIGGCPKMYCDECGKAYFLNIDRVSDLFCSRCVANELVECTEKSRKRRYLINAINEEQGSDSTTR